MQCKLQNLQKASKLDLSITYMHRGPNNFIIRLTLSIMSSKFHMVFGTSVTNYNNILILLNGNFFGTIVYTIDYEVTVFIKWVSSSYPEMFLQCTIYSMHYAQNTQ